MMLTCPSCGTRYLVPDAAIGPAGRKVRCAACKHSWFENAPVEQSNLDLVDRGETVAQAARAPQPASVAAVAGNGEADQPPLPSWVTEATPARTPTPTEDDTTHTGPAVLPDITPFAHEPPFRPRRNPARMWTIIAVAGAITLIGLNMGLLMMGGIDGISARLRGEALVNKPDSLLRLTPTNAPERRRLLNGHEILTVTGRIDNPTSSSLPVPDIRAELLDTDGKAIYSWTIPAPTKNLAAGASIPFDGVTVDVPEQASRMRLSFANGSGR